MKIVSCGIGELEDVYCYACKSCLSRSPICRSESEDEVYAAAMRRTLQKPLTKEQMKERIEQGSPVYAIPGDGDERWMFVVPGIEPPEDGGYNYPGGVDFNCVDVNEDMLDGDFYAMKNMYENDRPFRLHPLGWIAFDHIPTDEERAAAEWEE